MMNLHFIRHPVQVFIDAEKTTGVLYAPMILQPYFAESEDLRREGIQRITAKMAFVNARLEGYRWTDAWWMLEYDASVARDRLLVRTAGRRPLWSTIGGGLDAHGAMLSSAPQGDVSGSRTGG